ncbi:MAG TPA: family 43 glycosylhydrolase [Chloroflexota bacterium]|nr:family 43 glycosylhydrolase [Chloroflexota bacterium]
MPSSTQPLAAESLYRPLCPEERDQGDPFVFAPPSTGTRYRYYTYVTGEEAASGRAFPVYGSNDLVRWTPLGGTLEADTTRAHWAPCVQYVPGLERPYVMLYSRGQGLGEDAHIGHAIRRADAMAPEGPFTDSEHVLTPDLDFAIDPDVYRGRDGVLRLAFAVDFVDEPPLGTGIVEAPVADDLTTLLGPYAVIARAQYDWQVYDPARRMPWKTIPGVDWTRDTVRWHTVEAPAGGLISPRGEEVVLYSGGCFFGYYAVGAVVRHPQHQAANLTEAPAISPDEGIIVLRPRPENGFYGPGHCSWITGPDGQPYLMFHARYGSPDAPRQMGLAPLRWTADSLPIAEPP